MSIANTPLFECFGFGKSPFSTPSKYLVSWETTWCQGAVQAYITPGRFFFILLIGAIA